MYFACATDIVRRYGPRKALGARVEGVGLDSFTIRYAFAARKLAPRHACIATVWCT